MLMNRDEIIKYLESTIEKGIWSPQSAKSVKRIIAMIKELKEKEK
jgi:hypothetical protein